MAAPSSNAAIRKALRQFEDGLQTFCGQLATETAEVGLLGPRFERHTGSGMIVGSHES